MLAAAIAVAAAGFLLKLIAAAPTGWFLVPLAAAACFYHIVAHHKLANAGVPATRAAMLSHVLLAVALLLQMEYTPGYNCAEDTLSSVLWRLGLADEEACTMQAGIGVIVFDVLVYVPVVVAWQRMHAAQTAAKRTDVP